MELWEATRREQAADALMLRAQLAAIKPASNWRPAPAPPTATLSLPMHCHTLAAVP